MVATSCRFESDYRHHVGAKSALLRRLFMPMAKKTSSARSLATSFFISWQSSSRAHSAASRFQITTAALGCDLVLGVELRAAGIYTVAMFHVGAKSALLRRLFMPMAKRRHPPAPLLLLSNCDPLALGSQLVFFFQRFPRRNRSHSVPHFKIVATLLGRDLGRPMRAAIPILGGLPLTAWAFLMCPILLEQNGT